MIIILSAINKAKPTARIPPTIETITTQSGTGVGHSECAKSKYQDAHLNHTKSSHSCSIMQHNTYIFKHNTPSKSRDQRIKSDQSKTWKSVDPFPKHKILTQVMAVLFRSFSHSLTSRREII